MAQFKDPLTQAHMDLSGIAIDDGALRTVTSFLKLNKAVTLLDLSSNSIGDQGLETLCDVIVRNNHVEILDLSDNQITETGLYDLLQMLLFNEVLIEVRLKGCPVDPVLITPISALTELNRHVASCRS